MDEPQESAFKPPYLPFKTFWSFVEELGAKPLPPEIDRSLLRSKSGTDQANLLATLKSFGLITNDQQVVGGHLERFVKAAEPEAKQILTALLRAHYPHQFELSDQNATEKLLSDSFEEDFGMNGETRRKAVTFFLQAARFAGMTLSPHFPTTRLGSGRPPGTRSKVTTKRKPPTSGSTVAPTTGERITVKIGDVGSVALIVNVRWLDLPDEKFANLRKLTKDLRSLGEGYEVLDEPGDTEVKD